MTRLRSLAARRGFTASKGCERLCRQLLPRVLQAEGVRATVEVGSWWDRTAQVDLVGIRLHRLAALADLPQ